MRTVAIAMIALFALFMWTRFVWQSGFDQGADVSLCITASLIGNGGKLATDDPACKRADAYKRNPLWAIRDKGPRP